MRFVLVMVLAGLVALPLSVSAQGTDSGWVQEFYPELAPREAPQPPPREPALEPAPEEPAIGATTEQPALELKLDDAGVGVVPPPPRTPDGYTLKEMDVRVRRARIGLGISAGVYAVGGGLFMGYFAGCLVPLFGDPTDESAADPRCNALLGSGVVLGFVGLAGIITSGVLLARRKHDRDQLKQAHYGTPRRVQWDLAQPRLVF